MLGRAIEGVHHNVCCCCHVYNAHAGGKNTFYKGGVAGPAGPAIAVPLLTVLRPRRTTFRLSYLR